MKVTQLSEYDPFVDEEIILTSSGDSWDDGFSSKRDPPIDEYAYRSLEGEKIEKKVSFSDRLSFFTKVYDHNNDSQYFGDYDSNGSDPDVSMDSLEEDPKMSTTSKIPDSLFNLFKNDLSPTSNVSQSRIQKKEISKFYGVSNGSSEKKEQLKLMTFEESHQDNSNNNSSSDNDLKSFRTPLSQFQFNNYLKNSNNAEETTNNGFKTPTLRNPHSAKGRGISDDITTEYPPEDNSENFGSNETREKLHESENIVKDSQIKLRIAELQLEHSQIEIERLRKQITNQAKLKDIQYNIESKLFSAQSSISHFSNSFRIEKEKNNRFEREINDLKTVNKLLMQERRNDTLFDEIKEKNDSLKRELLELRSKISEQETKINKLQHDDMEKDISHLEYRRARTLEIRTLDSQLTEANLKLQSLVNLKNNNERLIASLKNDNKALTKSLRKAKGSLDNVYDNILVPYVRRHKNSNIDMQKEILKIHARMKAYNKISNSKSSSSNNEEISFIDDLNDDAQFNDSLYENFISSPTNYLDSEADKIYFSESSNEGEEFDKEPDFMSFTGRSPALLRVSPERGNPILRSEELWRNSSKLEEDKKSQGQPSSSPEFNFDEFDKKMCKGLSSSNDVEMSDFSLHEKLNQQLRRYLLG